ncbi:hypothetical protein V3C99_013542, partial [Haemonchus contortus]
MSSQGRRPRNACGQIRLSGRRSNRRSKEKRMVTGL